MKYTRWTLRPLSSPEDRAELVHAGLSPLCAAVLCARGTTSAPQAASFLAHSPDLLHDPFLLQGMEAAVARIRLALHHQEVIAVYGDYDVDGITSTCLLSQYLRSQGGQVVSYIPQRIQEGYGLNSQAIEELHRQGVTLIVTVDCGITATQEVAFARSLRVDVVITDHHRCKDTLPSAVAVVNPRRLDCSYPFPDLAGVGVALKLALALTAPNQRQQVLEEYSDLAAIGTVADVMPLIGENRCLVSLGLQQLAHTRHPGLQALLEEAGCARGSAVTSSNIGFGIAPRINAAGRMGKAHVALDLLLTQDVQHGHELAQELCQLNRLRQSVEMEIFQHCDQLLHHNPSLAAPVIVLAGDGWHQGVIGIVASRLAEKYACPTYIISLDGDKGKGSCRSYGGFNLFESLEQCSNHLEGYGGHALAAGFSVLRDNIPALRTALAHLVEAYAKHQSMSSHLDIDYEIPSCAQITLQDVEALSQLEPFGAGNDKPLFLLRSMCVVSHSDVGCGRHLKLRLRRDGVILDAIFFSANAAACGIEKGQYLDVVCSLDINQFRGQRTVQLQVTDLRPAPSPTQLEQDLFQQLQMGHTLSPWEASLLLPSRQDFVLIWRHIQRLCAGGSITLSTQQLLEQITQSYPEHSSYGKTLVCLSVFAKQGLLHISHDPYQTTVEVAHSQGKVDLEQAELMLRLRHDLQDI